MACSKDANLTLKPILLNERREQTLSFACVASFQPGFISLYKKAHDLSV